MKSELSTTAYNKNKQQAKKLCAFTLAEILLSLTVIGIVAAIALPSLLGNANERAWETQKKALYTRFSQAIPLLPSLNGYGELVGNLSDCADTNSCHPDSELKDTAAETFVRDGLSKVMKITNICDNEHLGDCDLPDKIISVNNETVIELSAIKSLASYNNQFFGKITAGNNDTLASYEQLNTKAAAFETVNRESILVYYNPNCKPDLGLSELHFTQPYLCANFIYDLNGKKGPNTVGKDIGFISALYATNPSVVAPNPYPADAINNATWIEASTKCKETAEGKLPNIDELTSMFYNMKLVVKTDGEAMCPSNCYWSSSAVSSNLGWSISMNSGRREIVDNASVKQVRCIKR